ncbi:MAG: zinc ribbon domain-containing protein [Candidatus Ozemobacteraceae bacterium]
MPTYEYRCQRCSHQFDRQQKITEASLKECPLCQGLVHRVMSGGAGFILRKVRECKGNGSHPGCSVKQASGACCGDERQCGEDSCHGQVE